MLLIGNNPSAAPVGLARLPGARPAEVIRLSWHAPTGAGPPESRCDDPATMLTHRCLDPQDPYAEREVRVAFEWAADRSRLIAALDEHEADILPDLVEVHCDDLRREIVAARLVSDASIPARAAIRLP
ncbi:MULTISPECIES: hypothetical protein [Methylobacterium]|uniref:hypothetical protein n=1 Tax=Methylobacterium TaxID=407 RepID=UPI002F35DCD1